MKKAHILQPEKVAELMGSQRDTNVLRLFDFDNTGVRVFTS